jgi:hypothetical protein
MSIFNYERVIKIITFINILTILVLIFLLLTILGFLNPKLVFKKNRFHVFIKFGFTALILFIILSLTVHFSQIL